jgi:uncharacterized membrane protein
MVKNSEVVSYVVFSSFCLVVAVVVELAVVEEGVVLRRGSLVLAPSEEKSTVVLVPPFGTKFTPTVDNGG